MDLGVFIDKRGFRFNITHQESYQLFLHILASDLSVSAIRSIGAHSNGNLGITAPT